MVQDKPMLSDLQEMNQETEKEDSKPTQPTTIGELLSEPSRCQRLSPPVHILEHKIVVDSGYKKGSGTLWEYITRKIQEIL